MIVVVVRDDGATVLVHVQDVPPAQPIVEQIRAT